jgi:hypothetical protein
MQIRNKWAIACVVATTCFSCSFGDDEADAADDNDTNDAGKDDGITEEEHDKCYTLPIEECEEYDFCILQTGALIDLERTCYDNLPAYCTAIDAVCITMVSAALDQTGNCWRFSDICQLPEGWKTLSSSNESECENLLHQYPSPLIPCDEAND